MNPDVIVKQKFNREANHMSTQLKPAQYRIALEAKVLNAAVCISPVWPIETFIACNPLQGFESLPFEEACREGAQLYGTIDNNPKLEAVNREMIKWCGAFLDLGQGTIDMPNREKGFYSGFVELAVFDARLRSADKQDGQWLQNLPKHPAEAIENCLNKLGVTANKQDDFLKDTFSYLPGWAGYVKWRSVWRGPNGAGDFTPITLLDFMAVRLVITCILWPEAGKKKIRRIHSEHIEKHIQTMEIAEKNYRDFLVKQLLVQTTRLNQVAKMRADVQMVFCIDVRSEPFRHQIEALGNYETLGFAGFFGLPVRIHDYNTGKTSDSCPVLLKPRFDIHEQPMTKHLGCVQRHEKGQVKINQLKTIYQDLKYNFSTPFSLVETMGAFAGVTMLVKTLAPTFAAKTTHWLRERIMPTLDTEPNIKLTSSQSLSGIAPAEQLLYAEAALTIMGLTHHFAKIVMFCGHGSSTQNNPYASALDCGACGGNHGGANAKLLAAILNAESIRKQLAERGIVIPDDTLFTAAEHNTTTDAVTVYESDNGHMSYADILLQLNRDFSLAKLMNTKVRCSAFGLQGQYNSEKKTLQRSHDWSEVRPEWGLARNAAFIIGPRKLTAALDLQGRCFLHSYEWQQDEAGASLETILTAPMVVAEWINTQYLFSTIDNVAFGSGSKVTHNVTGKLGIMQGNGSDLMHGLPLQSVMSSDENAFHEPQRLLVVVYAPRSRIMTIIQRQDVLKKLFFNGWVNLVSIDPEDNNAYQLSRKGDWNKLTLTGENHDHH